MSTDALKRRFEQAAEIAKLVPEHLQEAAFNRALDALLSEDTARPPGARVPARRAGSPEVKSRRATKQTENNLVMLLCEKLDRTQYPAISAGASALDNALRVILAAREECQIEWLAPSQITAILKTKFLVKVDRTSVSKALAAAGGMVDRRPEGKGYVYRLMGAGEKHIQSERKRGQESQAATRVPKRQKTVSPKTDKAPPTTNARRRTASARPGPKKMLEELIGEGYFDEPRAIGDIISHISQKRAHTYKPTDLSPALVRLLRDNRLEREHNAEHQFVYHKP